MEYEVSLVAILFLSILVALTAKYNLLTVPWIEVIRKPKYFGGKKERDRGFIYLAAWITCSLVLSALITFTLKNSSGIAKSIYGFIGYDNPSAGSAGLITTVLFNVIIYLFLVNKTKHVLREESENPPEHLLKNNISNAEDEEIMKSKSAAIRVLFRKLYYFIPSLLAHVFRYFYFESNHLVQGVARLTFDKYGKETILGFFQSHIDNSRLKQDSRKSKITELSDALIKAKMDDYDRALALLEKKIEIKGYFSTKKFINNYIEKVRKERQFDKDRRSSPRIQAKQKKQIKFTNGDGEFQALVPEYSEDCCGVYLATAVAINMNQPIKILIDKHSFELKVIHKNVLISCHKTYSGCGAKIVDDSKKGLLSDFISA